VPSVAAIGLTNDWVGVLPLCQQLLPMCQHAFCCFPVVLWVKCTSVKGMLATHARVSSCKSSPRTHQVPICLEFCSDGSALWVCTESHSVSCCSARGVHCSQKTLSLYLP
jgi:hypothetical protein